MRILPQVVNLPGYFRLDPLSSLPSDGANCVGLFRTTFRTVLAPVAQWIEQRFPKPQVACSIHAEGTNEIRL